MSMAGKRKDKVPGKIRHADHDHPQTKHYSVLCRKNIIETGQPLSAETERLVVEEGGALTVEPPLTRGQKAAATRARRKAEAEKATAVDALLDSTEDDSTSPLAGGTPVPAPVRRDSHGRFTRETVEQWQALFDNLEGAQDYLVNNDAELLGVTLTVNLGGVNFVAEFDGHEWTVGTTGASE